MKCNYRVLFRFLLRGDAKMYNTGEKNKLFSKNVYFNL